MTTAARALLGSVASVVALACAATPQAGAKNSNEPGSTIVLSWSREGGFAGFCDELKVTATGDALATSCRAPDKRTRKLSADELRRLDQLRQDFGSVTVTSSDQATADAMKQTLTLAGRGSRQPSEKERGELLDLAQSVYSKTIKTTR
jgi:hypothetical protein